MDKYFGGDFDGKGEDGVLVCAEARLQVLALYACGDK
jgi:hypothetical protein